ncbi:MAG: DJ-1 family glyoxalase III [Candidatus Margulisiibacteriota bacterium]
MTTALVILADGFEEVEAVSVIDILRRAQIEVTVAGMSDVQVRGAHDILVRADVKLSGVGASLFDAVILPGGEPGTTHLQSGAGGAAVKEILTRHAHAGKWLCAICAAPRILDAWGFLDGRQATSFPGTKPHMTHCHYREDRVVLDGQVITSRGPGTALEFAVTIVEKLVSPAARQRLEEALVMK